MAATLTSGALAAPRPVLADLLPGVRARSAVLVLAGALFTALCAQIAIQVPPSPVPVTGQTLAVVIVGATLGARRGAAALALYLLLGLALPVYAEGSSGWHVVWGPTGGYLIGFIVAAAVIGHLAARGADRRVPTAFAIFALGQLIVFGFGVPGLMLATGQDLGWSIHNGFTLFIAGGLMKAALAGLVLPSAWRLVRRFDGER
ncbi:Substrate-specific component BioY of biotin ECF transporter [Patulibacter medicamentivorans]|jgi:biotin transport system substrate-specific component|uniref:Biotin transporter n=1 Tax=Patulibacter medicamentivorans TaxID=1097667 RepID=H0E5D7_9ACTN|nr:biotin transporter BioY [Patulibacter medicamentivorans]EHN11107.1 Substrate-specific component BioY of biotin ECF transporter [Patulibacter medicamentivorans]